MITQQTLASQLQSGVGPNLFKQSGSGVPVNEAAQMVLLSVAWGSLALLEDRSGTHGQSAELCSLR